MAAIASPPLLPPASAPLAAARDQWWCCLFEASEDAQLVCRRDGAVLEVNRRARDLLGLSARLALPAYLLPSCLTPATLGKLGELLGRPVGHPESLPAISLLCRGQLSMVADLHVTPLDDHCSLVVIQDAGRRWRMESHVQRLITAINATTDVVYLTDAQFRLTFVNPAFQQVTGHTIEDALGQDIGFLRAPAERSRMQACIETVARGEDWRGEMLNVRRDGSSYPVEATVSPIFDRHGAPLGFALFERDITAQQRLQQELQLERDYTQSIIDSVDAGIYTVDRDLRLRYVNRQWQTLPPGYGWLTFAEPPHIGRPLLDYIREGPRKTEVARILAQVLRDGQPQELRGALPEGRQWVVKVTPWKHEAEVLGLNYVVLDQTKFCQLQAQLFQAEKMETIGELAAGVAHDFNNLILAIRGNVALLQLDDALGEAVQTKLGHIDQAASRAAEITQQLLSFSRSSEEKEVVLDFNQVIKEAGQLARRTLKNRVELKVVPTDEPLKVRLDATRAHQILLNLMINAADAMPKGGLLTVANHVRLLTADQAQRVQRLGDQPFLCCCVTDTGTGIPPEVLPRIFDPFFTTKSKGKGTGLGLAIVHGVVTRAGGFVEVQSTEGEGTTFLVYLPTAEGNLLTPPSAVETGLVKGTGRVLIVDDMDFILDFTRAFLSAAGYEVLVALSAEEALMILEKEGGAVDALLTDFNMPGRTGLDLIKDTKARWPHVQCLLASGHTDEEETRQIRAELGTRILHKPYSVREATDLLGEVLANRPPPAPPAS
jgi:PAS domain S-box-containing protein